MNCPPNMDTDGTGKSLVTHCMCNPGYESTGSDPVEPCEPCPHGYFKETLGNFDCVPCKNPADTGWTDSVGADSREQCQCKAADGYIENKDFDPGA